MYDPASVPFFRLEIARLRRHFAVLWLRGTEAISQPYTFELEITHQGAAVDPASLMYKSVFLSFKGSGVGFHGQIHSITRSHYRAGPACYRLQVGPRLACLDQRCQSRHFQQLTAPQIIARILEEHGVRDYRFELKSDCRVRELCTQYQETDLQLIQRLCHEEGLHYHFCHSREEHEMIIGDGLRGFARSPAAPWRRIPQRAGVTHFAVATSGDDTPGSRAGEQAEGASTLPFVRAGQLLPLIEHPVAEWNHMWLVTKVEHHAPASGEHAVRHDAYSNRFQAIPWEVGFVASQAPSRRSPPDLRRAWVLGAPGEEAERDRYRRVRVQFDKDGEGLGARYGDCWLPLAPGLDLPVRGGMAVAVGFLGGDMDRPLIVAGLDTPPHRPTSSQPRQAVEPDSVCMQLDWQMLLGEKRSLRLDGGPTLDLHADSELTVQVGASRIRLDARGLTLISPRVTFASQPESAREPAIVAAQAPGDGSQAQATHQSEHQEGQP
ncbi:type IV secretion protein Rhs [Pseudomonas sp. v388]|uniref:contractile injection system protein, VgrG/Pvc8 family n=1 Tax=Pseudomonas sp. v388 TaxID=2479849 RepID=UPI000F786B48|nr:contractile injection system protein, VgrG/Pvc8 family [Pseudomonas sp. v388]RRV09557.1 type IV secretion protein Rhs [Pseudomonas sp. v388]